MQKYRRVTEPIDVEAVLFKDREHPPAGVTVHPVNHAMYQFQSRVGGNWGYIKPGQYLVRTATGTLQAWDPQPFERMFLNIDEGPKPEKKTKAPRKTTKASRLGGNSNESE